MYVLPQWPQDYDVHLVFQVLICSVLIFCQLWQVLSSSLYYSSARNLICGSFLLYSFRIFERRFGSKRYAVSLFPLSTRTEQLHVIFIHDSQFWFTNLQQSLSTSFLYMQVFIHFLPRDCGTPRKIRQGCVAHFTKPLPYLGPKFVIFRDPLGLPPTQLSSTYA